jgi:hypothetical protein
MLARILCIRGFRGHTSTYSFQWNRRLMYSLFLRSPLASNASVSMAERNTGSASSSRNPGISMLISTHEFSPASVSFLSSSSISTSPPATVSSLSFSPVVGRHCDFSTSAFTPTIASVPSAKHTRALPFAPGRISLSATKGRNWVGERPSGRIGGLRHSDECMYESSAGESSTWEAWTGPMAL